MREAKAEARREEDRKLLRKFLIDPDAYEGRVRERLACDGKSEAQVWS